MKKKLICILGDEKSKKSEFVAQAIKYAVNENFIIDYVIDDDIDLKHGKILRMTTPKEMDDIMTSVINQDLQVIVIFIDNPFIKLSDEYKKIKRIMKCKGYDNNITNKITFDSYGFTFINLPIIRKYEIKRFVKNCKKFINSNAYNPEI